MADDSPHQRRENRDGNEPSEKHYSQSAGDHTNATAGKDSALSPSVVFGLLAAERRRYVLYYLDACDGKAEFYLLAEQVAAWENETSIELTTAEMIQRVSTGLYHTNLPKLADHGLIDDGFRNGPITLTDTTVQVAHYVDLARELDDKSTLDSPNHPQSRTEGEDDG